MSDQELYLLPSLRAAAEQVAHREGTSVNQILNLALAEKLAALNTAELLGRRAKSGSKDAFLRVLDAAPDTQPETWDCLDQPSAHP